MHTPIQEQVLFEEVGNALEVKLNRPKALNALQEPMLHAIFRRMQACACAHDHTGAQVVLLTGSGGKVSHRPG